MRPTHQDWSFIMSLINKEIADFSVQAYQNGDFKTVSRADVLGKWGLFFFYPADFTFVCPTELEDLANLYDKFQEAGCEVYSRFNRHAFHAQGVA